MITMSYDDTILNPMVHCENEEKSLDDKAKSIASTALKNVLILLSRNKNFKANLYAICFIYDIDIMNKKMTAEAYAKRLRMRRDTFYKHYIIPLKKLLI